MEKQEILLQLDGFRQRLLNDVVEGFRERGGAFGRERFASWRRQFNRFLDEHLPGQSAQLDVKLNRLVGVVLGSGESDLDTFLRLDARPALAFIDSLKLDVESGEVEAPTHPKAAAPEATRMAVTSNSQPGARVFIVHGHDEASKVKVARLVEKLGYEAVILHEQANRGMTVIEKIEANSNVGFAVVIYSPDDAGNTRTEATGGELLPRARQNVVFEHGYLIAKLGRDRVAPLVVGNVELPSDISGMVYMSDQNWESEIAKEMKAAGYEVDLNKVFLAPRAKG